MLIQQLIIVTLTASKKSTFNGRLRLCWLQWRSDTLVFKQNVIGKLIFAECNFSKLAPADTRNQNQFISKSINPIFLTTTLTQSF